MNKPTFNHNGGVWTRPDIPSAAPKSWVCAICQAVVDSEPEQYHTPTGDLKQRYIPASRYWNGNGAEVYCSSNCACKT